MAETNRMKQDLQGFSSLRSNGPARNHEETMMRQRERPFSNLWKKTIAVVALLDWLSTFMSRRFFFLDSALSSGGLKNEGVGTSRIRTFMSGCFFFLDSASSSVGIENEAFLGTSRIRIFSQDFFLPQVQMLEDFCHWLDRNNCILGFLFSVLWCIDAFRIADRDADKALGEWEQRRFMKAMGLCSECEREAPTELSRLERYKTWTIYVSALLLQFLFLPVGFYLLVFKLVRMNSGVLTSAKDIWGLLESTYNSDNLPQAYRTFSNETKLSLGFSVAKHSYKVANIQAKRMMRKEGWRSGRKLGLTAILHPIRSWKNSKNILSWVRWIRYLVPLFVTPIGYTLKVRGHIRQLYLTFKQRQQQKKAVRTRRKQWLEMTENERRLRAAKRIQSTYRSYLQRQACLDIMISLHIKGDKAARKLQQAMRALLARVKASRLEKESELKKLERKRRKSRKYKRTGIDTTLMAFKDRLRLNELRNEDTKPPSGPRGIDSRLLMRPDSTFHTLWRCLFLFCVIVEVILSQSNGRLERQAERVNGKSRTVSSMLQNRLGIESLMDMKECSCIPYGRQDYIALVDLQLWQESCRSAPWYCRPTYYYFQTTYSATIHFIIEQIMTLMAVVFTVDVPFFFFTGKYEDETGLLIARPFFRRWLIPGLMLQLVTNPRMEVAGKVFFKFLKSSFEIGPIRVWRWIRALFYPLLVLLLDLSERFLFVPLVAYANRPTPGPRRKIATTPEQEQQQQNIPQFRRASSFDAKRIFIYQHLPQFGRSSSVDPKRMSIYQSGRVLSASGRPFASRRRRASITGTICSPQKLLTETSKSWTVSS